MSNAHDDVFECYREAVYARLRRYTAALDDPDDRAVGVLARVELPRYLRYWMTLLTEHEPEASGKMPELLSVVEPSPGAVRHVEMGTRRPDTPTRENHGTAEPDRRTDAP